MLSGQTIVRFTSAHLADAIVARMTANPGMTVTILLEGEPVGGIEDQEKWICQQIENASGQVYFMYNDAATDIHDRYNYQHGKWMIVDEEHYNNRMASVNYSDSTRWLYSSTVSLILRTITSLP